MTTPTVRNSPTPPHSRRSAADRNRRGWLAASRPPPFARGYILAAASLPLACGPIADSGDAVGPVVETETIGDTTVVRTVSGSVWDGDATLVPETSVGELDGPEEYIFGSIGAIAVDDDHNMYVLDEQARHVRVYDADGTYLRTLGRAGVGRVSSTCPSESRFPAAVSW